VITVTLSMDSGTRRQDVLLSNVPRVGDSIRLANGLAGRTFVVEHVLWLECQRDSEAPAVVVVVRERGASLVTIG
jgi:hypothetical protein